MKKIGVLTSGGDSPGMNAYIRAVVRCGINRGLVVVGIHRGYCGILEEDFIKLGRRSVANIIHRGGTVLETSRCEEMKTEGGVRKASEILQREGIDGLITIGGYGTFRGAVALAEAGGAFSIAQQVWQRLRLEYRICVLGHVQRGGSPTARDRILASKLGAAAVDALVNGMSGYMVGELKGEIAFTPLR